MNELHLKGLIKNKKSGEIIVAFASCSEANEYRKKLGDDYEYKEAY